MMFVYTKHAEKKIKILAKLNVVISKKMIEETVKKPINVDQETDWPRLIASAEFDATRILRVVYKIEIENDIIVIITCYPAEKGRYFKYEN